MAKRVLSILMCTAIVAFIVGCSGSSEPGGSNDLSGTFGFSAVSSVNGDTVNGTAVLTQSGSSVTGNLSCTSLVQNGVTVGCTSTAAVAVTGTVSGATVNLSVPTTCTAGTGTGSPVVVVATIQSGGGTVTGTYTQAADTACNQAADDGNVTLTK
jgi:hypothetical protein